MLLGMARMAAAGLLVALVFTLTPPAAAPAQQPVLSAEDGRVLPPPVRSGQNPHTQSVQGKPESTRPSVLVKRKAGLAPTDFKASLVAGGFANAEGLLSDGWWRLPLPDGENVEQAVRRLQALPGVESVEEDRQIRISGTPDDPYFPGYQWPLPKIQALSAWDLTRGNADVWIAILDTGIDDTHPDKPSNLQLGYDFVHQDDYPFDDHGHGTHVAGIAAASTDNEAGIAGVCPSCGVLAVKVMDQDGMGRVGDIADGIKYAAYWGQYYGKRTVINLSLGSPDYSRVISDAVSYAQDQGALVIAAAGNSGPDLPNYPAALPGVLAVSATTPEDKPAYYSQYGDIGAPGGDASPVGSANVLSSVPLWYSSPPYAWMAGTSMASPHVAGAAGLVWSLFPSCSAGQVQSELQNTVDVPSGWFLAYGRGRLNVDNAILRVTTSSLPSGTTGAFFSANLAAWGGSDPRTFSIHSGTLPPGLNLSPAGVLSGVPNQSGSFSFTVRVADGLCETVDHSFALSVYDMPSPSSSGRPMPYRVYFPSLPNSR